MFFLLIPVDEHRSANPTSKGLKRTKRPPVLPIMMPVVQVKDEFGTRYSEAQQYQREADQAKVNIQVRPVVPDCVHHHCTSLARLVLLLMHYGTSICTCRMHNPISQARGVASAEQEQRHQSVKKAENAQAEGCVGASKQAGKKTKRWECGVRVFLWMVSGGVVVVVAFVESLCE